MEAEAADPESFANSERFVASESEVEFVSVSKSFTATGAGWWGRRKTSREIAALRDVSFLVRKAEIVGLVGQNGAGKSTLLRLACGILRPSSGRVLFLGQDPARYSARILKKLGFVMGARSRLIWDLPAQASFQLHKEIYGIEKSRYLDSLSHLNSYFHLEELLPRTVRDLSLGQRMRLDIALALLHAPEVLLLDEASIALDARTKEQFRQVLGRVCRDTGTTVILASNDLEDVRTICKRVLVLANQELIFDGGLQELYDLQGLGESLTLVLNSFEDVEGVVAEFSSRGFVPTKIRESALSVDFKVVGERDREQVFQLASQMVGVSLRKFEWGKPSLEELVKEIGELRSD